MKYVHATESVSVKVSASHPLTFLLQGNLLEAKEEYIKI